MPGHRTKWQRRRVCFIQAQVIWNSSVYRMRHSQWLLATKKSSRRTLMTTWCWWLMMLAVIKFVSLTTMDHLIKSTGPKRQPSRTFPTVQKQKKAIKSLLWLKNKDRPSVFSKSKEPQQWMCLVYKTFQKQSIRSRALINKFYWLKRFRRKEFWSTSVVVLKVIKWRVCCSSIKKAISS